MGTLLYEYSTTDGKKYRVWSTGKNTEDVETEEQNKDIDDDYDDDCLRQIKKGEQEIKEGKRVTWIPNPKTVS